MRGLGAALIVAALTAPAIAETPEGPLAISHMPPIPSRDPKPVKPARKAHAAKAAATASPLPHDARPPAPEPAAGRGGASDGDPLTFGFKWQGTNDTAEKTRVQNLDGNAPGTGAEVGVKLHF